ncbi:MAG: Ig-like domain-containing protein [Bacilli bacterium]|nr:Ig-like domain-containing protein [Bacilli bacterium]
MSKKNILFLTFLIILMNIIPRVSALDICKESEMHKKYREINEEERKNYIEPRYCELEEESINTSIKSIRKKSNIFPSRYNSNDYGYITKVKSQGRGGSCWAFATIGAVEANAKKNGLGTFDLSEMHMLYSIYGGSYTNNEGRINRYNIGVNDGGFARYAAAYFFGGYNMLYESDWTYDDTLPNIPSSYYKNGKNIISIKNYRLYNIRNSYSICSNSEIETMKKQIMEDAAVVADIYTKSENNPYNKNNNQNYLQVLSSQEPTSNHEILVVGWDDSIPKDKFLNATRDGAWIVKNSWGDKWTDDGYFYVSYDDHFICGNVSTFTGTNEKTYKHTYKGSHLFHNFDIIYRKKAYFATKIEKESLKNEKISRISFGSAPDVSYNIYMSPSNTYNSNSDWILLGSGISTNYGIESIDVSNNTLLKNTFSVIIEYIIPNTSGTTLLTSCLDNYDMKNIKYDAGRNYYSGNGIKWTDMIEMPIGTEKWTCGSVIYVYTDEIDNDKTIYPTSISFNKAEIYLEKGKSESLIATFNPTNTTYKTLTWKSTNPNVAVVTQEGLVLAKTAGTTYVTAETSNHKVAQCLVTVYDSAINPTSISLNYDSTTLYIGENKTLYATIFPYNSTNTKITWTSSNPKTISIDNNGIITALTPGSATITATTENKKTATCYVTSLMKEIEVTSISMISNVTINVNETKTLEVFISPNNSTNKKVTWESYDTSIVVVDENGKITGIKDGITKVSATSHNGLKTECTVIVTKEIGVYYKTHIQDYGWEEKEKKNGEMSGTSGQSKRLEAIRINLKNMEYQGNILYRSHIESYGWEKNFKKNGEMSGTSGQSKRLEAIEIKLDGEISNYYDLYYRVHVENYGWLGWAKNGEQAGSVGYSYRLEGIEIMLVKRNTPLPSNITFEKEPIKKDRIYYSTHVQDYGWLTYVKDGEMSGTTGQSKRLEAIRINLNNMEYQGDVLYRSHIESYGWEKEYSKNGEMSGTSGESKRLEAIEIKLTGELANHYDIYYRVHVENYGWLGWAKNGEQAGSAGYSYRLEGIEIILTKKNYPLPSNITFEIEPFKKVRINYSTHVQDYGWLNDVKDGEMSGTTGQSKRIEGIKIKLKEQEYSGNIEYRTYIHNFGWEPIFSKNGELSGTTGKSLQIEAIEIKLTGEIENYFDVYYRVHSEDYGWLNWAKNGEKSGTVGLSKRLEGIEIVIIKKGTTPPIMNNINNINTFIE